MHFSHCFISCTIRGKCALTTPCACQRIIKLLFQFKKKRKSKHQNPIESDKNQWKSNASLCDNTMVCRSYIRMWNTCIYAFESFSFSFTRVNDDWKTTTTTITKNYKNDTTNTSHIVHLTRIHEFHRNSDKFSGDSALNPFFERELLKKIVFKPVKYYYTLVSCLV